MNRPLAMIFVFGVTCAQLMSSGCYRMYSQPNPQGYGGYPMQTYPSQTYPQQMVPYQQAPIQTLTPGQPYVPTTPGGTVPTYQPGTLQPVPDNNFNNGGAGSPFFTPQSTTPNSQQLVPNPYNSTQLPTGSSGVMPVSGTTSPYLQPTPRTLEPIPSSRDSSANYTAVPPNLQTTLPAGPAAVKSFETETKDEFSAPIIQSTTPAKDANPFAM